jgi:hypothetical protein
VDGIAAITVLETHDDVIIIAHDEIACLDDMSLEGDISDNSCPGLLKTVSTNLRPGTETYRNYVDIK